MPISFFQPASVYLGLEHFKNVKTLKSAHSQDARSQFIAQEIIKTRLPNETYTNNWFILMREGKWGAEVEKTVSQLYLYFMGYSTDINIVCDKVNDIFYVASRGIKNFIEWERCLTNHLLFCNNEGKLFIKYKNRQYQVTGLGELCALTEFFGESDSNTSNFGIQIIKDKARAFKIDNEKALDFFANNNTNSQNNTNSTMEEQSINERIELEIQNDSMLFLGRDITQSNWFQQEKELILEKIAHTDFKAIEAILRSTITSNKLESARWLYTYFTKMNLHQDQREEFASNLEKLNELNVKDYGVEYIINALRQKHQQLRSQYCLDNQFNKIHKFS